MKFLINNSFSCLAIRLILTGLILSLLSCNNVKTDSLANGSEDSVCAKLLSIEDRTLRLGEISKEDNNNIKFEYEITNTGNNVLSIDKIDVSCSCVSVIDFPRQLKAGESGKVKGMIDLTSQSGHIRKSIFVNYCDTCVISLKVIADII